MHDLNRRRFIALGAAGLAGLGFRQEDGLIVHEWGVVTIPYGSATPGNLRTAGIDLREGKELPAGLPPFVMTFEKAVGKTYRDWTMRPVNKPIVYFYSKKKTHVWMKVSIPTGRPRAWYPEATAYGPQPKLNWGRGGIRPLGDEEAPDPKKIVPRNGFLQWSQITVDPKIGGFRKAEGWWAEARNTDATPVSSQRQKEKFVFYDAFATFDPELLIRWKDGGKVHIENSGKRTHRSLYAIRVEKGKCFHAFLSDLKAGADADLVVKEGAPESMSAELVKAGLYKKEADGLVKIWTTEFFKTDGVRILSIVPRKTFDEFLPLEIKPKPAELNRVLIAHIECLDPARRRQIEEWIEDLSRDDLEKRTEAWEKLRELGPLTHDPVREALEEIDDPEVKARLKALLGD